MGIRFTCEHCQKRLNVKSFLAGKKGLCPKCGGRIRIPLESEAEAAPVATSVGASGAQTDAATSWHQNGSNGNQSFAEDGKADSSLGQVTGTESVEQQMWFVSPPGGGQYGPANRATVEQWIDEGRVSADTLVWREGWQEWEPASKHFVRFQFQTTKTGDDEVVDAQLIESEDIVTDSAPPSIEAKQPTASPAAYPRAVSNTNRRAKKQWIWIALFALLAVLLLSTLAIVLLAK